MNFRLIAFSAIVTAGLGAIIGIGVGDIAGPKYISRAYKNLRPVYIEVGAVAGLIVGGSQESIRQVKKQRDQEEILRINRVRQRL